MLNFEHWHSSLTKLFSRFDPSVTSNDVVFGVDQSWVDEPKTQQRTFDEFELTICMHPRIIFGRAKPMNVDLLDTGAAAAQMSFWRPFSIGLSCATSRNHLLGPHCIQPAQE